MATLDFATLYTDTNNDAEWDFTNAGPITVDSGADPTLSNGDPATITFGSITIQSTYVGVTQNGDPIFTVVSSVPLAFFPGETIIPSDLAEGAFPNPYTTDTGADFVVCFAAGTQIGAPDGEVAVENLKIGDPILTADGRTVAVKWIGRQTVTKLFTPAERFAPVRVQAGALGNGLPHTDLVLTADHALIIDGLAINAGVLVNGTTITRDPVDSLPDRVTYYHVETEGHEEILANGVPAETYVDYVTRRTFDNYQEYFDLYGEEQRIAEMPLPRVSSARLLPNAIKARLASKDVA